MDDPNLNFIFNNLKSNKKLLLFVFTNTINIFESRTRDHLNDYYNLCETKNFFKLIFNISIKCKSQSNHFKIKRN